MAVVLADVIAWLQALQRTYAESRECLTELDAAIGDADHGINMDRGFSAVVAQLESESPESIDAALKLTAMTLIRTVGGASGPLYGTFFLRASTACAGVDGLDVADVVAAFQAGIEGVQQRGRAEVGDKTMLDALVPALEAMQCAQERGASLASLLADAARAADEGMRSTIPMQARKGRASYLGERSIGHQDPGATSAHLMVREAAKVWA